jgi:hypothetical protein
MAKKQPFNIYYQTMTQIAIEVLGSDLLLKIFDNAGVKPEDWKEIKQYGQAADGFDRQQKAEAQALEPAQKVLDDTKAIIEAGIRDISTSKKAILRDLAKDASSTAEEKVFVRDLSFATPVVRKSLTEEKRQEEQSKSHEARKLQITRMVEEIGKRPRVVKAFSERKLDAETLAKFKQAAQDLTALQKSYDAIYNRWLDAGASEREEVSKQREVWDSIRLQVGKLAKNHKLIEDIVDRLRKAREKAKTGLKHAKPSKVP